MWMSFCFSLMVEEPSLAGRLPQSQSSIAHRCVLNLDRMFPLPLGVVICNFRKPMPQLARPHPTSCLKGWNRLLELVGHLRHYLAPGSPLILAILRSHSLSPDLLSPAGRHPYRWPLSLAGRLIISHYACTLASRWSSHHLSQRLYIPPLVVISR
jgi:hypothetical protein